MRGTHRASETGGGYDDARTRNLEACAARPASRQVTVHASRRVRARGDPSRARRQTRRRVGETGDCDRVVESAARRRQAPAAKIRIRANEEAGGTRDRAREAWREACFTAAVARINAASAPARTCRRESYGVGTTSQTRGTSSRCPCTSAAAKRAGLVGPLKRPRTERPCEDAAALARAGGRYDRSCTLGTGPTL